MNFPKRNRNVNDGKFVSPMFFKDTEYANLRKQFRFHIEIS